MNLAYWSNDVRHDRLVIGKPYLGLPSIRPRGIFGLFYFLRRVCSDAIHHRNAATRWLEIVPMPQISQVESFSPRSKVFSAILRNDEAYHSLLELRRQRKVSITNRMPISIAPDYQGGVVV